MPWFAGQPPNRPVSRYTSTCCADTAPYESSSDNPTRTMLIATGLIIISNMALIKTITVVASCALYAQALDLRNAVIVVRVDAPSPEKKAAQMLTEEIFKRTQLRLEIRTAAQSGAPAIVVGTSAELGSSANGLPTPVAGADGYRVAVVGDRVVVAGNDPRGTLFGTGYLLRHL